MSIVTILVIIALVCAILSAIPKISCPLWVSVILLCIAFLVNTYGT